MKFTKMHGTGNDFVVINGIETILPEPFSDHAKKIADRHFGIGCDQILVIENSEIADFGMSIYNNDGGKVEMCGNGIRCLARYVCERGMTEKKQIKVETLGGIVVPEIMGERIRVDMGEPSLNTNDWLFEDKRVVNKKIKVNEDYFYITLVSMGNPHCVVFVNDSYELDLAQVGPHFENHEIFPNRVNTEFVKLLNKREVEARVWERGSGETLACGTGASAIVVASVLNDMTARKIIVHLKGGDLEVEWADDNHVYMTGAADFVFEGTVDISLFQ